MDSVLTGVELEESGFGAAHLTGLLGELDLVRDLAGGQS